MRVRPQRLERPHSAIIPRAMPQPHPSFLRTSIRTHGAPRGLVSPPIGAASSRCFSALPERVRTLRVNLTDHIWRAWTRSEPLRSWARV